VMTMGVAAILAGSIQLAARFECSTSFALPAVAWSAPQVFSARVPVVSAHVEPCWGGGAPSLRFSCRRGSYVAAAGRPSPRGIIDLVFRRADSDQKAREEVVGPLGKAAKSRLFRSGAALVLPGVLGVPGVLGTPGMPGAPGVPGKPGMLGMPGVPGAPIVPGKPGALGSEPSFPGVPGVRTSDANVARTSEALDPVRPETAWEYQTTGTEMLDQQLESGGSMQVTSHTAVAEAGAPPGALEGTTQVWRAMRFKPPDVGRDATTGGVHFCQSITKVCIAPPGHEPREWLRSEALVAPYMKSQVSVVLAALSVLGAPVLPEAAKQTGEGLRILCIGLGGGGVPSFFAEKLGPHCQVDVVELEQAVVTAACEAMGFVPGPRLSVVVEEGAAFALRAAEIAAAEGREGGVYDAVVIDAYDDEGEVPRSMWEGSDIASALAKGLLKKTGLVAINFLIEVDLRPPARAYRAALSQRGCSLGFSVTTKGGGNRILVQTCGGPPDLTGAEVLAGRLRSAADAIREATDCPFDMSTRAALGLELW